MPAIEFSLRRNIRGDISRGLSHGPQNIKRVTVFAAKSRPQKIRGNAPHLRLLRLCYACGNACVHVGKFTRTSFQFGRRILLYGHWVVRWLWCCQHRWHTGWFKNVGPLFWLLTHFQHQKSVFLISPFVVRKHIKHVVCSILFIYSLPFNEHLYSPQVVAKS